MANNIKEDQLNNLAVILAGSIIKLFESRGVRFSARPKFEKKPIVEFMRRMRIFGMEKFDNPTYISIVNFYLNTKQMKQRAVWGLVAIYIEQDYMEKLLRDLQYPVVDSEDVEDMKDACGAVCNIIAGQFRAEILDLGFANLEMSHFSSYLNNAQSGVEFYNNVREKFEIGFFIKGEKRLVAELTMGPIPQA